MIAKSAVVIMLFGVGAYANAITREDKLECTTTGGGTFILRSKYEFNLVPLPVYHHSRESNRGRWHISYRDVKGRVSEAPGGVDYHGQARWALDSACAHVGVINGVPLAPFTFMNENGVWSTIADFPWEKLDVNLLILENPSPEQKILVQAGMKATAYHFGMLMPIGSDLVYEKPLFRDKKERTFDAVFQSTSHDDGKSWSAPMVTESARIFEVGKGWAEQSFRARPVSLNGKLVH